MKKLKSHRSFDGVTEFWEHESAETKTSMKFSLHRPLREEDIRGGLIWLSGLTCTEENFISKAGIQQALVSSGLAVFCPDTSPRGTELSGEHESYDFGSSAGFYVDSETPGYREHYRMFSYVHREFRELIDSTYSLKGNISLFGHSMGGHGALVIGLNHPEQYRSISAFAPICNPTACAWGQKAFHGYLGDDQGKWRMYDATLLLKNKKTHPNQILIDQGLQDEFLEKQLLTEAFERTCSDAGQKLQLNFREGFDHSYYFISTFVRDHVLHHRRFLDL